MSRIIYLLGAGASRGQRGEPNPKTFNTHAFVPGKGYFDGVGHCANIISGVPIVNEIPGRLQWLIQRIRDIENKNQEHHIGASNPHRIELINELEWLASNASKHASIDTFAKKLFLTDNRTDYYRLKRGLTIFLNYEQMVNPPDPRYDSFLASILQNKRDGFPDDVSIVSWNYDVQLEMAYREYYPHEDIGTLSYLLNVRDKNQEGKSDEPYRETKGFRVLKLNGSAYVNSEVYNADASDNDSIEKLCKLYQSITNKNRLLSFAWEEPREHYIQRIFDCVKDASVLVVIGYSFPFFNREIDRMVFKSMRSLGKIYIQDPNAENVKQSLRSALTPEQLTMAKLMNHVECIPINENQFFLPPEL